jgi:GAF domain-containing protein
MDTEQVAPGDPEEARLNRLLNLILETAVDVLGYDAASVTTRVGDALSSVGVTDQRVVSLDEAQYATGEGPCLQALDQNVEVFVGDIASHDGWDLFQQTADYLGIRSSLSLPIGADTEQLAASLNLYSRRITDRNEDRVRHATGFAAQLAAAMDSVDSYRAAARLARELADAMRSRATIEQAKGILIAERNVSPEDAFALLVQMSQNSNTKVATLAAEIVADHHRSSSPSGAGPPG